jgi:hypothetical protein
MGSDLFTELLLVTEPEEIIELCANGFIIVIVFFIFMNGIWVY